MAQHDGDVKIAVNMDTKDAEDDLKELVREINNTLKSVNSSVEKITTSMEQLNTQIVELGKTMSGSMGTATVKTQELRGSAESLRTAMSEVASEKVNTSNIDSAKSRVDSLANSTRELNNEQKNTGKNLSGLINWRTMLDNIKHSIKDMPSLFSKAKKSITNFFKNLKSGAKDSEKSLKRMLVNLLKYTVGVRSLYFLYKRIRSYGTEALKALALESAKVNSDMSRLLTSFSQAKYSLASFLQPILSIAVPVLEKFAGVIVKASEALGKFFAVLAGQNYIYKANKVQRDYAESLSKTAKAAKEARKELGEYDRLKVIPKNTDTSGGSGSGDSGLGDLFRKENFDTSKIEEFIKRLKDMWQSGDFTSLGQDVARGISEALDKIPWDKIKTTSEKLGTSIATFLNGAFGDKHFAESVGTTLGEALNTAINFAFGFIHNFDWKGAGSWLATAINTFFSTVDWEKAGQTLYERWQGILDAILTFIQETDWQAIGQDIGKFTKQIKTVKLIVTIAKIIWEIIKAAFQLAVGMFQENPLDTTLLAIFGLAKFIGLDTLLASKLRDVLIKGLTLLGDGSLAAGAGIVGGIIFDIFAVGLAIKNWNELFEMNLEPGELSSALFDFLWGDTNQFWQDSKDSIKNAILGLIAFIGDLLVLDIDKLQTDWETYGEDLLDGLASGIVVGISFLTEPLRKMFNAVCDLVKNLFGIHSPSTVFKNFGLNMIQGMIEGVNALKDKLIKAFTSMFDKILKAVDKFTSSFKSGFDAVKTSVKTVTNSAVGIFNKLIDVAQGGINSMADGFSKFKIDVPDWVPGIGGKKYNFNLPKINLKKIPSLATGAVIPPNKRFLAELGDQRQGTNIEAPLETIKQALLEVLDGGNGSGTIDLTVNLDGSVIYNKLVDIDKKKIKQNGRSGFGGGR